MSILVSPRASRAPTTTEPPSSAYASGAQSPSTNTSSATRRSVRVTFDGTRVLTSPVDDPDLDIVDNAWNEHESSGGAPNGASDGGGQVARPARHMTQQDQDKADEVARKKAMKDLVQSWMDRLQLISLLTTFFAGMEAQLVSASAPTGDGPVDKITQTANAAIIGALVVHSYAAIVSFLAAFALVRYKLKEAKREEAQTEVSASHPDADPDAPSDDGDPPFAYNSSTDAEAQSRPPGMSLGGGGGGPIQGIRNVLHHWHQKQSAHPHVTPDPTPRNTVNGNGGPNTDSNEKEKEKKRPNLLDALSSQVASKPTPDIFSTDPHLEQVGPGFRTRQPPTALLERAYVLSIFMTAAGFVLAIVGIVAYAWASQPGSVAVVATVACAVCALGAGGIMI